MKTTMTVLFVIAMVAASTQTFRHVFVKWIEPSTSVLDEFQEKIETKIELATEMSELVALYKAAKNSVDAYEADEMNPKIDFRERKRTEPYKTEQIIKKEIKSREYDNNQLFKLIFYWLSGLVSLALGIFALRKYNKWLGFSGIVVGFSEMICWTSPLFHTRLMSQQFDALLNYKLVFSFVTLLVLIGLWLIVDKGRILEKNS